MVVSWRLWGEKELKSKLPSCRWETGISKGASSADNTDVKEESAAFMEDSGRWKAGFRLGIIEGVRTRTEGFGAEEEGAGCDGDSEVISGRNV